MVDIHSHILPKLDDGASSVEESINMLEQAKENKIEVVIATPHFHPQNDFETFLKKREESFEILKKEIEKTGKKLPKIKLGCELNISADISKIDLEKLCIEGTQYILVEMPYTRWTDEVIDRLYYISYNNFTPILAHIERFFNHRMLFNVISELGAFCQINAGSVVDTKGGAIIDTLFKKGVVQFLGSDSHNTSVRKNRLLAAYQMVDKKYGKKCGDYLAENAYRIIENKEIEKFAFKKKNFIRRFL